MTIENYSARDFDTWEARLQQLAGKWFVDAAGRVQWTDHETPNTENTMRKMMSRYGDEQAFMRDNYIGEAFVTTVRRKENLLKIARMFSYTLTGPGYASADVTLSIPAIDPDDVVIPVDTLLSIGNIQYYTTAEATIAAGDTSTTGSAKQVSHRTETVASTNRVNQEVLLSYEKYVDDTMAISTAAGAWTQVSSFLDSDADDLHFKVFKDEYFKPIVIFGDGATGKVPEGDVTYSYDTTMGTEGRVTAGKLEGDITVVHDLGTKTVSYVNAATSTGGTDGMGTGEAKAHLPDHIRSGEQLVTNDDYETFAESYAAIADAYLLTMDDWEGAGANTGHLYLVAKGEVYNNYTLPAAPTATNISDAETGYSTRKLTNFLVIPQTALFKTVNIETVLYIDENYDEATVAALINTNLKQHFAVMNPDGSHGAVYFGISYKRDVDEADKGLFPWSHLFNVIRDTDGVEHVPPAGNNLLLNSVHEDVKLLLWEFPILGTVKVINAVTSNEFNF